MGEKLLVENIHEADVEGFTALHHATFENLPEIAQALVEAKVDLNAQTEYGFSALHIAAIKNRLDIGNLLIDANANLNVRNAYQNTPLDSAFVLGRVEFIELVRNKIRKSEQINKKKSSTKPQLQILSKSEKN